jgi:uncharacterized protein
VATATPMPMLTDRVLKVADLVGRPGASRPLALEFDAPEDLDLPLAEVSGRLRLAGVLESVVEGLLIRGVVHATLELACARCLSEFREHLSVPVVELFTDPQLNPQLSESFRSRGGDREVEPGYEIRDQRIDLDTLLRDTLVPAVPLQPRCRPNCRGLCPLCGQNRNEAECACHEEVSDSRWAALQTLRLPPERH